ncbi:hypothetical protein V7S43_005123 [Phytophthora oleae]|uniref:Uncharacterized protein n=1 Tax=Phytophthora oleae TaxID=2107226 RepID=A0ABD3FUQ9_9STRA
MQSTVVQVDDPAEVLANDNTSDKNYEVSSPTGANLLSACGEGQVDTVQKLLKQGVSVDFSDDDRTTPLIFAAEEGHLPVVQLLLENGASVDLLSDDGWTALMAAAGEGYADIVQILLEKGASADTKTRAPEKCIEFKIIAVKVRK